MSASVAASDHKTKAAAHTTGPSPAVMATYARQDLVFDHGEGSWLVATMASDISILPGVAVNSLGHGHPQLVAALTEQADKLWHVSNLYRDSRAGAGSASGWPKRRSPTRCSSPIPAPRRCECAIKTARRYQFVNGHPERFRIITFEGAFHGRTLATIAAGGQQKYLEGFGPQGRRLRPGAASAISTPSKRRSARRPPRS